jgi:RNA polymerase sigma-70 factor (ECF subfamily)
MEQSTRKTWSDDELLAALRGGEPKASAAQGELGRLLRNGLRRALASIPAALEWVDDFAQEASIRVLRQLSSFRGDSRFSTWALTISVRVAFDELRRRRWRDVSLDSLLEKGNDMPAPGLNDPEKLLARKAILNKLRQAIETDLSPRQRLALTAELKGVPQSEIGRKIGGNRNSIYKLTHDARKKLRTALSEQGITAESIAWIFSTDQGRLT